ncbi:caspase, EACC1-associated type [Streptomyces sp. NBC_01304]|uniref:caspase, EACC1-associated type n=1 Tax=Streptomyces sp. NBC_01304 TaxID=2903818 RepID=UPI002E12AD83|nr:caspase family protein [Streptomyces sp. NBC_01304]
MNASGRYALVVATGDYQDEGLRGLLAPTRDATELAEVLADPAIGGFDVDVLDNPDANQLRVKIEDFFADRSLRDTLVLHFACHGLKGEGNRLFLAATDTRPARLASTAVPAEYVSSLMMASRAQRVAVLLDCCFAGLFERGMISRADSAVHVQDSFTGLDRTGNERGRAVVTASSAVEYAYEGNQFVAEAAAGTTMGAGLKIGTPGSSLFTGALVEGLRTGQADLDGDGEIGLAELADYIGQRIRAVTPQQNPQLWMFGAQGDLPIARARRRVQAVALPERLAAAATSANREQRLWAVDDLGTMLHGPQVPLALTAHSALAQLARDDSRRVAEAAQRMLASAFPRIVSTYWNLGRVPAGTPGAPVLLGVDGPPIVRATLQAVAEPWLRVRYVDRGLTLSVDAPTPGPYAGGVTLRTATGELVVQVTAEVTATGPDAARPSRPRRFRLARPKPQAQAPWFGPTQGSQFGPAQAAQFGPAQGSPSAGFRTPPQSVRPPGVRRAHAWPFAVTATLMLLVLVMPAYRDEYDDTWVQGASYDALPLTVAATAVLLTCGAMAILLRRGAAAARHRALRWWYDFVVLLALAVAVLFGAHLADPEVAAGAGSFVFYPGCLLLLWGVVPLWRIRNRRRHAATQH